MSSPPLGAGEWEDAKTRYIDGLTDEECCLFVEATPENLYYKNGVAQILHRDGPKARKLAAKLRPLVMALKNLAKFLEASTQASEEVTDYLWLLWGSLRILITVGVLERGLETALLCTDEIRLLVSTSTILKRLVPFE